MRFSELVYRPDLIPELQIPAQLPNQQLNSDVQGYLKHNKSKQNSSFVHPAVPAPPPSIPISVNVTTIPPSCSIQKSRSLPLDFSLPKSSYLIYSKTN